MLKVERKFGSFNFSYYLCIVIKKTNNNMKKREIIKFLIWSIVLAPIYYVLFMVYSITPATIIFYIVVLIGLFIFFYFVIENKDDFKI